MVAGRDHGAGEIIMRQGDHGGTGRSHGGRRAWRSERGNSWVSWWLGSEGNSWYGRLLLRAREVMVGAGEVMVVAVGSGSRGGECDGEMMMAEGEVRRGYCWEQG